MKDKEKQIEEIAKDLYRAYAINKLYTEDVAEHLYNSGYRKQREGEWLLHKDGRGTCKACRRTQKAGWDDDRYQNYCGCCGAKMKGGEYIA